MKLSIHPHISTAAILESRGLGGSSAARRHLANTVARLSDPYVPMESGTLKNTRQIEKDGKAILYNQPYAHYQYHGEVMGGRAPKQYTGQSLSYQGGPMRGREWDVRAMADRGEEVVDDFAKFVGGKRK